MSEKVVMQLVIEGDKMDLSGQYGKYKFGVRSIGDLQKEESDSFREDYFDRLYQAETDEYGDTAYGDSDSLTFDVETIDDLVSISSAFSEFEQYIHLSQAKDGIDVRYTMYNTKSAKTKNESWNCSLDVSADLEAIGSELQGRINRAIDILTETTQ